MPTLGKQEIQDRLRRSGTDSERLVVTPILDRESQLGNYSIDLRLANQFIIFKLENLEAFNPLNKAKFDLLRFQEPKIIPFGGEIVLHPGSLMLGATFEYIKMPTNLEAQVEGRSSWARLGLVIATATSVDPGFSGSITLELSNLSKTPIVLTPGVRICQMIFRATTSNVEYKEERKYNHPIGPQFSKIFDDSELKILNSISK